MVAGAPEYDDFYPFLRVLEPSFMNCVKDLRSQVVREGCITVAYVFISSTQIENYLLNTWGISATDLSKIAFQFKSVINFKDNTMKKYGCRIVNPYRTGSNCMDVHSGLALN